jgi:hypothetical protein
MPRNYVKYLLNFVKKEPEPANFTIFLKVSSVLYQDPGIIYICTSSVTYSVEDIQQCNQSIHPFKTYFPVVTVLHPILHPLIQL